MARNYQTVFDEPVVESWEIGASGNGRRLQRCRIAGVTGLAASLDSFTQTLSVFNGLPVSRIFTVMLFNALLSAPDVFDLESAVKETFL